MKFDWLATSKQLLVIVVEVLPVVRRQWKSLVQGEGLLTQRLKMGGENMEVSFDLAFELVVMLPAIL